MTREEIGRELARMRNGKSIGYALSGYAVKSIEESRSSYPVSNLLTLCQALNAQFYLKDTNTDERYPVDTIEDCHKVIKFLMDRYETDEKMVYRITGTHYTPPKGVQCPLSINTLFDICKVLKCDVGLFTRN